MMRVLVMLVLLAAGEPVPFESVGGRVGFVLKNSATPEKHQIETMPGGVALFDFDNDGKLDLFFCNGARQPDLTKPDASWWNRLYRNKGNWQFEDVTAKAGLEGSGYDFGVAAGDFDNDGLVDLFVAGIPESHLYRNRGDGTFQDVTTKAGVKNRQPWPISGGWFDFDRDGLLDLFVVNYVRWDPKTEIFCGEAAGKFRTYCHPKYYQGLPNTLFRNNGDGTFSDVSAATGLLEHVGKGMGLAFADYDGDGWMDVFVANDTTPNFLFRNVDGKRFEQVSLKAGVAYNDDGRALSSMGVDFRDVDGDGKPDLFTTALANETYPLYRNLGKGLFLDVTYPSGIGAATLALSGWGAGIYDFDNDGKKDLFAANGDVNDNTELFSSRASKQKNSLLRNLGGGKFAAQQLGTPGLHRGTAFGDIDGDGRADAVVTRLNDTPVLLKNTSGAGNHWIGFRLRGTKSNRDGIGAAVRIRTSHGEQWNHATTSVGYISSSEPVVRFGLGAATEVAEVEVRWPGGAVQTLGVTRADRIVDVAEPH